MPHGTAANGISGALRGCVRMCGCARATRQTIHRQHIKRDIIYQRSSRVLRSSNYINTKILSVYRSKYPTLAGALHQSRPDAFAPWRRSKTARSIHPVHFLQDAPYTRRRVGTFHDAYIRPYNSTAHQCRDGIRL